MTDREPKNNDWVRYNVLTDSYDTPDGTCVPAELVETVQCLADVFYIAQIRAKQRAAAQMDKDGE